MIWKVNQIREGQRLPYQDSIYEYIINSDLPEEEVKQKCLTEVRKCAPERHAGLEQYSGHCGFPFGLDSFYRFRKLEENKYQYIVVEPFTG